MAIFDRVQYISFDRGQSKDYSGQCYLQKINEEFEDTNWEIRIRISMKNRQHKKYKRTNNDLQNIHIKLKIE
jgi:hypothetical protein